MKKTDIKRYLNEYSIYGKRRTTINHAFASALSVADIYNEEEIDEALKLLGQNPKKDLRCVYCNKLAETWDHISALVVNGEYSGFGHQLNNLIPCCKNCNSAKGNKSWRDFVKLKNPDETTHQVLINKIESYINYKSFKNTNHEDITFELEQFKLIKQQVLDLLIQADEKAKVIREKLTREK